MLKRKELIGVFGLEREEVRPFTDKQIALVQTFAAQAVIAIENTRLLNELRESLDHQTATADILRVIASTPEDSKRALDTIAETAAKMFDAANVHFRRVEGDVLRIIGEAGPTAAKVREALPDYPLEPTDSADPAVRCVFENRQITFEDRRAALATEGGKIAHVYRGLPVRSQAFTPLSRQGEAIGLMIVTRSEVRPFRQDELNLMTGFADQAVIAIENGRLLSELRESLEQQTATSEVLRVISSSPSELAPIFQTMLANAIRLCDATFGLLLLYEGDWRFRVVAMINVPPAFAELRRREPIFEASPETGLGRAVTSKDVVHIADYAEEAIYKEQRHPAAVALGDLGGARTYLVVPMLKDKEIAGAIAIYRQQVRRFADKQIELVKSFAAQAVIAIENTRLLNELRQRTTDLTESLEQQTATSEVLKVIYSSSGELQPVFHALLEKATHLCAAKFRNLYIAEGDAFRTTAMHNVPAFAEARARNPVIHPEPGSTLDRIC
jgi:GAF domain-containing protein